MLLLPTLLALLATLLVFFSASASKIESHTFEPQYATTDANGDRQINNNWRIYGSTVVNNNFIRLTPDRQSKKGAVWSRKPLGLPSLNSELKFRISGQGKNMFGDGLAMWVVQQSYYVEGNLHGFQDKFTGVGIIFDTFKNTETLHAHKDITILINDGEKTFEMMTEVPKGCDLDFRYHAARADFNVNSNSVARIVSDGNSLNVQIDPKGTNEFVECVTLSNLGLPADWLKKSYIGFTATTGQLADNHDILSFVAATDEEFIITKKPNAKLFESRPGQSYESRISDLETAMNEVMRNNEFLDHHVEHEFADVNGHIDSLQSKLKAAAAANSNSNSNSNVAGASLVVMEPIIKRELDSTMANRLTKLETDMRTLIERRVREIDGKVDRRLAVHQAAGATAAAAAEEDNNNNNNNNNGAPVTLEPAKCPGCSMLPLVLSMLANLGLFGGFYWFMNRKGSKRS